MWNSLRKQLLGSGQWIAGGGHHLGPPLQASAPSSELTVHPWPHGLWAPHHGHACRPTPGGGTLLKDRVQPSLLSRWLLPFVTTRLFVTGRWFRGKRPLLRLEGLFAGKASSTKHGAEVDSSSSSPFSEGMIYFRPSIAVKVSQALGCDGPDVLSIDRDLAFRRFVHSEDELE